MRDLGHLAIYYIASIFSPFWNVLKCQEGQFGIVKTHTHMMGAEHPQHQRQGVDISILEALGQRA